MRELTVKSERDVDVVARVVRDEFERHGDRLVRIISLNESLRERQRGLYWRWCEAIAGATGYTRMEVHEGYKERFLVNIYLADPDNHRDLADIVEPMQVLREHAPAQYRSIRRFVLTMVSHLDATKANMAEYLRAIEADALSQQIQLPYPPEKASLLGY